MKSIERFASLFLPFLVFALASCTSRIPSPEMSGSGTPSSVEPISTAVPVTATPTSTGTPIPSATPTFPPSPTSTPRPTPQPERISAENAHSLQLLRELGKDPVYSVIHDLSLSPNEDKIAVAGEKTILVDLASKESTILGGASLSLDFSQDGNRLVVAWEEDGVDIWDLARKETLLTLAGEQVSYEDLAWANTGDLIAGFVETMLTIWDARSGEQLYQFELPSREIQWVDPVTINWSPTHNQLAITGIDAALRIFDGERLFGLGGFNRLPTHVSWSPDGSTLAATSGWAADLIIWRTSNWNQIGSAINHKYWVSNVEFSPDGSHLLTADAAGTIYIRNPRNGTIEKYYNPNLASPNSVHWSPDGTKIFCDGCTQSLWVYDTIQKAELAPPDGLLLQSGLHYIPLKVSNQVLLYGKSQVQLWDVERNEVEMVVDPEFGLIDKLKFSPDGAFLAVTESGIITIVDGKTGAKVSEIDTKSTYIFDFVWSPDSKAMAIYSLATVDDPAVHIWDIQSGEIIQSTKNETGFLPQVAWSPGNNVVTGDLGGNVIYWDPATGEQTKAYKFHREGVRDLQFSPNGKLLASVVEGGVYIRDEEAGKVIQHVLLPEEYYPTASEWSPDGSILAVQLDHFPDLHHQVLIIDVATGEISVKVEMVPGLYLNGSVSWSSDGDLIVLNDGEVINASTGERVLQLEGVSQATFSPGGLFLIGGAQGLEYWGVLPD